MRGGFSGVLMRARRPEELVEAAQGLAGKRVDVFLIHEAPYLPGLFPFLRPDFKTLTALEAIRLVRPGLVVNGHLHREYKLARLS